MMQKPDFDGERRGVFCYGQGNLSKQELEALAALVPRSWFLPSTRDRVCRTDAQRLIGGVDEAIGLFDAKGGAVTAAGNAVKADVKAIASAAAALMRAIQQADKAARVAINMEASICIMDDTQSGEYQLTQTGEFSVNWYEALRHMGHQGIASEIEDHRVFERRSLPLLSALWDLSADAVALAKEANKGIASGANIRPDRINADTLARFIISHAGSSLGRRPPVSTWFY
ncbi:MAG: hypothetical protein JSS31_19195 [Proteobacteria bacterium]|nr:hypothetical protein [Pseudomonadota bacterium]